MGSISLKYKSKSGNLTAPGDVDPGAMIPIATTVVSAGGVSNVEFTAIPSSYMHLQIRGIAKCSSVSTQYIKFQFNSDTASNYSWHELQGTGASAIAGAGTSTAFGVVDSLADTSSSYFTTFVIDILDYSDANKYKTIRSLSGFDTNGGGYVTLGSSNWRNTNVIDSIKLFSNSGNFSQYSHFALYGIKRAGA